MTDGFRNRVTSTVVPVAQRNPDAFRSGLAEGAEALGRAAFNASQRSAEVDQQIADSEARIAQVERSRRLSATVADRMGAWPDVQLDIQNKLDDLRRTVDPASPDYQAKADAIVTDGLGAFKATLSDPEVVERFAPIMATFGASTRQAERRAALGARTKQEGTRTEAWRSGEGLQLQNNPDPERLQMLLGKSTDDLIDALDLPAEVKATYRDQAKRGFARNFLDGLMLKGQWQGARGVLDQGLLDQYLDPDTKKTYLRQVENAGHVAEQEQAMAAGRVRAEARDAAKAIEAKVRAGVVPTPAEMRQVRGQLAGAGVDEADLIDFDALSTKVAVNRAYAGKDPLTVRRDRDALAARMAAGTATATEQMTKAQLDDLVDEADKRQADQLRTLVAQGTQGKLQALSMLSGTPEQRHDVAEKMEAGLGAVANLGPRAQAAAIDGREVRKARPKDFGSNLDADTAAKGMLGGAIVGQLGAAYGKVRDVAWDIMSHNLAVNGRSGFDEGVYRTAVATAMGATLRPGGVMQGGVQRVRGRPVWVPSWQTGEDFDQQLSRTDFSDAVYANGVAVDKDDVLASYRPEYFADDANGMPMYRMVDASGGWLRAKGGDAFVVRPRKPR